MDRFPSPAELARSLGAKRSGSGWSARCPAHEDHSPSLSISTGRDGRAIFNCFSGCTYDEVIAALRARGLWPEGRDAARPAPPPARAAPNQDEAKRRDLARRIWGDAAPIAGTLGETYLRARGISMALPPTLRFARLFHSADRREKPAVICAIQNSANKVTAIQRIFLRPDGLAKTDARPQKPVLGPMEDGAVRMGKAFDERGRPRQFLGLAEGPETALSAQQYFSLPVWCSCGVGRMTRVAIPAGIRGVYIFADAEDVGLKVASQAAVHFQKSGLKTRIQPPDEGDWNDVVRAAG